MALPKRISLSILVPALILSGCISDAPDTETAGTRAEDEPAAGLPPGDFITFFDGKGMAAAPYVITDGMVVVDGDIVLGKASELLGRDRGDGSPARPLAKGAGNISTTAMAGQANHWQSGRIPYVIETDDFRKSEILLAIRDWNDKAAVIWVPKTEKDADHATSQSLTTGIGWPMVRPFVSGGLNYILHYNPADGQFRTYPFNASQGMVNNPVEWGTWNPGWSMIEFYTIGAQTYGLFYNRATGTASFYAMNANGKLGAWIENQGWYTNWDIARVYRPVGTEQRYMFLYNKGSGLAHIWGMKANRALDLSRNTYSQTLFGYEDFQAMENVNSDWVYNQSIIPLKATFLLYHDQHNSTQFLQIMDKDGKLGKWVTTSAVGTGFTQVGVYHRANRSQAMYFNNSTGKLMICDVKPVFTGTTADPPLTAARISAIRSHTTLARYQVHNFNINPWGNSTDPRGAERLFLFDPSLKRFWNSNLVPFPAI